MVTMKVPSAPAVAASPEPAWGASREPAAGALPWRARPSVVTPALAVEALLPVAAAEALLVARPARERPAGPSEEARRVAEGPQASP